MEQQPPFNKNTKKAQLFLGFCILCACGLLWLGAHKKNTTTALLPHQAIYNVSLKRLNSSGNMTGLKGILTYEWRQDCTGNWLTHSQTTITYNYADDTARTLNSEFSTVESLDGKSMSFATKRNAGGADAESVLGNARLDGQNKGQVTYSQPTGLQQDLPIPTYFPMDHARHVLDLLAQGKTTPFYAYLFDGSDSEGPSAVNTVFGGPVPTPANLVGKDYVDQNLLKSPAHQLSFSFFDPNTEDASPKFEMQVVAHANGVISHAEIDYDAFSVVQDLNALKALPIKDCSGGK